MNFFYKTAIVLLFAIQPFFLNAQITYFLTDLTSVTGSSSPLINSVAIGVLPNGIAVNISESSPNLVFANNFSTNNSLCYFNSASYVPNHQNNTDAINITSFETATSGLDSFVVTFSSPLNEIFMYIKELDFSAMYFPTSYNLTKISGNATLGVGSNGFGKFIADNNPSNATLLTCNQDANSAEGIVRIQGTNITRLAFASRTNNPFNFGDAYLLNFGLTVGVVPISLSEFTANVVDCGVDLNWKSETEINSDRFEIELSIDGINFETTASVLAKGLSSRYYKNLLNPKAGNSYVRLKMIDKDGTFKYSDVIRFQVNCKDIGFMKLTPNLITEGQTAYLNFYGNYEGNATIKIYNTTGKLIYVNQEHLINGYNNIQINCNNIKNGNYFIKLENEKGVLIGKVLQLVKF